MNMSAKIVKYIDSYYLYTKTYRTSKFLVHETCGEISGDGGVVRVEFLKQVKPRFDGVLRGLLIPRGLLLGGNKKIPTREIACEPGAMVLVEWEDVTLVSRSRRTSCSVMQTIGILEKKYADRLVIADPVTIRKHPNPKVDHPSKRPTFYVIPLIVVKKFKIL